MNAASAPLRVLFLRLTHKAAAAIIHEDVKQYLQDCRLQRLRMPVVWLQGHKLCRERQHYEAIRTILPSVAEETG